MATQAIVRRIALALPEAREQRDRFAFDVEHKGKARSFAWVWLERIEPKKARVPNASVLALRTPSVAYRDLMIAASPRQFFTEPHYNGYPAVLVRLKEITAAELRPLLEEAWRCVAPPALVRAKASPARRVTHRAPRG